MTEQEQGGAVQSASELASQVWQLLESAYDAEADQLVRERDAAIRRAAIEECLHEGWLRHAEGCSAEHGDEYRCRCALRAFLDEVG